MTKKMQWVGLAAVLGMMVSACGGATSETRDNSALTPSAGASDSGDESEVVQGSAYDFYRSVAKTLLRTNQPAMASRTIRKLFKLKPESAEPYFLMGQAYLALRQFDAAQKMFQTAVDRDGKYAEAYSSQGVVLNMLGRHQAADDAHQKAIELDAQNGAYHNNLGFSLYLQGKYDKAIRAYQRALELDPGARRVHNNLGFAYGRLGDDAQAYHHFKLAGLPAQASNNMGFVHETRGDLEKAYQYYKVAVKQDSELVQARRNLERVCKRLGRPLPEIETKNQDAPSGVAESPAS